MQIVIWDNALTERLASLWAESDERGPLYSASQIAKILGCVSRNAVIGKVRRLGLPNRMRGGEERQRNSSARKPRQVRHVRLVDFEDARPPIDFIGVTFLEATDKTCMYAEGDGPHMLFCGQARRDESSYCPGHHAICWVKPRIPAQKLNIWRAA
jgi:GcrA cell cycle regulator